MTRHGHEPNETPGAVVTVGATNLVQRREEEPVHDALALLQETRNRPVTPEDLARIQEIVERQLRQLAMRGGQRATEAMDAELDHAMTPVNNVLGAPPTPLDPMRPAFEVEQQETAIVLEVSRLLRTRAQEQDQASMQKTTNRVAAAAVIVALVIGLGQIIVALLGAAL